ncbi:hypothetical protein JHK82_032768 [Glycine max]|uniref:DUF241 domain protein n=1 Tax=Glycine soja TaxID=3848 RepID=A0A445HKR3_GLYSO|nr:uncharacterized protein LOC114378084 [Glycine soja]KAG5118348.1 hypothetical protein JHK82_032768 [Glycine max]KAG5139329.1 hypothetical protein JHK84_033097 [Glycine max]KHN25392.1 hypothetical protein glysoja_010309 [Glycine soja]RZB74194.1 hypothetical protein D0Y65_033322 [Glycine soja]
MAAIETNTKSSLHIRSNSLPSAPHPFTSQFEEHLHRLKDSKAISSSTSSSINYKLNALQDLHECADKLLLLPITQQALARECSNECVDELLDGSVRILDICSTIKDCLLQHKERVHELESAIRRRRDAEAGFTVSSGKYLASRKQVKKAIRKALGNLKGFKNELIFASSNKDNETLSMLSFLKESELVTVSSLKAFLLFITGSKGQSKQNRWSIISKLMQPNRVGCDSQEADTNEFEKVDAALMSLINHKSSSIDNFQSHMENLGMCIENLEVGFECLSRQLIRTRVSLLNIFNH